MINDAEKKGDYPGALELFKKYNRQFEAAKRYDEVIARFEKFKSSPQVKAAIEKSQNLRDCDDWIRFAETALKDGNAELASQWIERVLKTCPTSEAGIKAIELKKRLPR